MLWKEREGAGVTSSWLGVVHNLGVPKGVFPILESLSLCKSAQKHKVENCYSSSIRSMLISPQILSAVCFPLLPGRADGNISCDSSYLSLQCVAPILSQGSTVGNLPCTLRNPEVPSALVAGHGSSPSIP